MTVQLMAVGSGAIVAIHDIMMINHYVPPIVLMTAGANPPLTAVLTVLAIFALVVLMLYVINKSSVCVMLVVNELGENMSIQGEKCLNHSTSLSPTLISGQISNGDIDLISAGLFIIARSEQKWFSSAQYGVALKIASDTTLFSFGVECPLLERNKCACHDRTITQQLEGGIRLLDVRIKPKKNFQFITCHGSTGSLIGMNECQSLISLLGEVEAFLNRHGRETVVMTLKADDWPDRSEKKDKALEKLDYDEL